MCSGVRGIESRDSLVSRSQSGLCLLAPPARTVWVLAILTSYDGKTDQLARTQGRVTEAPIRGGSCSPTIKGRIPHLTISHSRIIRGYPDVVE